MAFEGYPRDAVTFLQELAANNNKAWFEANKARYEAALVAPSVALVEDVAPVLADMSPALQASPKINGSIRRIYRDTRFSKDKTPYHTHFHLNFWTGSKPNAESGVHVVLGADGFAYGAGHWAFSDSQLSAFRSQVLADGGVAVRGAVDETLRGGVSLDPPALKTVPRGFDKEAAGADWLRHKGLVVRTEREPYPEALFGPGGVGVVTGICQQMLPLIRYCRDHLK